jgi:hypothetical protein
MIRSVRGSELRQDSERMSNSYEHQPLPPTEPWLAQNFQPSPLSPQQEAHQFQDASSVQPIQSQPPLPPPPHRPSVQNSWQPAPPVAKQNNALAITALVVAVIALLMAAGGAVSGFLGAIAFGGLSSLPPGIDASSGMQGTAPAVVEGQGYSGDLLQKEIARVVAGNGGDVTAVACPATPNVAKGVVTACHGVVDGTDWSYKVTFQDGLGHFNLDEQAD